MDFGRAERFLEEVDILCRAIDTQVRRYCVKTGGNVRFRWGAIKNPLPAASAPPRFRRKRLPRHTIML